MDQQIKEIEENFKKASDLLRVRTFVKHLKNENMAADALHLISTTYEIIERLKSIAKDIDRLHNMLELNVEDQYQLYIFEVIKGDMLNEIRDATKTLESKTNLMAKQSVELTVVEDLDIATDIFKEMVRRGGLYVQRT